MCLKNQRHAKTALPHMALKHSLSNVAVASWPDSYVMRQRTSLIVCHYGLTAGNNPAAAR